LRRTCTGEDSPFHPFPPVGSRRLPFAWRRLPPDPRRVSSLAFRVGSRVRGRCPRTPPAVTRPTRLIGRGGWSRFCSSAGGLPPRACARSPARRVGGLSSWPRRPREPGFLCRVTVGRSAV